MKGSKIMGAILSILLLILIVILACKILKIFVSLTLDIVAFVIVLFLILSMFAMCGI